ncbi:MAG: LptA/OstA family protein [Chthoniobacteraceae bacterium]
MMRFRITPVFAALLMFGVRASAQGFPDASTGRTGLDISGIESARPSIPVAPAEKFENAEKPVKRPKGPTEITAREATFDNSRHFATFTTEVYVRDPEFGLSCERLTVNLKQPAPPGSAKPDLKPKAPGEQSSGIEKAVAEGSVIITQDKVDAAGKPQRYTGKARRAVFDNTTGTLTLYGWPQISESIGGSVTKQTISLEESCVITLNRSGKMDVKGYHKTTIQDASDLNQAPR